MNELLESELLNLLGELEKQLGELKEKRRLYFSFEYKDIRKMADNEERAEYLRHCKQRKSYGGTYKRLEKNENALIQLQFAVVQLKLIIAKASGLFSS
jgi:hypothetical protein